jgi:membrane peptidoglycan carboxypeptidase
VSIAYYKDGKTELGRFYQPDGNRTNVPLSKVPEHVQQAVLAAEDRTFYTNSGVSPTGLARAFWSNVRGGEQQGGSTITQQYVKNLFLTSERSYSRKTKEFLIALKINQQRSKSTILEGYLNTIHFGRGANGIQAAAQTYFKKNASQLTVSEGAFLAGIIKGPSFYDPADGPAEAAAARARWNFVLDGMVSQGWLEQAKRPLRFPKVQDRRVLGGRGGSQQAYLLDMVRREAVKKGFDESKLNSAGLRIVTTFDKPLIDEGEKAVRNTLGPRSRWPKGTQAAMATIDPETAPCWRSTVAAAGDPRTRPPRTSPRPARPSSRSGSSPSSKGGASQATAHPWRRERRGTACDRASTGGARSNFRTSRRRSTTSAGPSSE